MDRIAEAARLNKRLIYYYFQDKERLFQEVLENAYRDIREREKALRLLDLEPCEALSRLVEFTWNYYLEVPEFLTLLNSANLHKARHLKESGRARELTSPLVDMLATIIRSGQERRIFRDDIDPVQLYISIAALAYFYLSNNHTLSAIFGRDLLNARARRERLAHMQGVILGYVRRG